MTNPLTALPPRVRQVCYVTAALVGLFLGACQVYGAESLGPVDVSKALEVLGYLVIGLGLTAASNVPSYEDVADGDAPPPDGIHGVYRGERGDADLLYVLAVVLVVVLLLAILL